VDDDSSSLYGFIITSPDNASTSESTASSTFTVKLSTAPTADVTMTYYSSDTSEGTVSGSSLVFSSDNYSTAQTITVTGVDDSSGDGDQYYQVVLMPVTSSDTNYNGADPQDIAFTNLDDDSSTSSSAGGGFIITAPDNATTSSKGDNSTFTVELSVAPTKKVNIPIYVSDSSEALLSTGSDSNLDNLTLTFTTGSWNTAQTVTVTGQRDYGIGDTSFEVILMPATSDDSQYNGVNPQDLTFVNIANDFVVLYSLGSLHDGQFSTQSPSAAKVAADSLCDSSVNKQTGYNGYAFLSFDTTMEIRDLPTNASFSEISPVYGDFNKTNLVNNTWIGMFDTLIDKSLSDAGVITNTQYWTFSNTVGNLYADSCSGGTSNSSAGGNANEGSLGHSNYNTQRLFYQTHSQDCSVARNVICVAVPQN